MGCYRGGCTLRGTPPLMAIALIVCGCRSDAVPVSAAVRDSAGIEIVENAAGSWTEALAWRVSDAPALEIGATSSADPAYEFSRIRGVTRLSDGRIIVLESQSAEVRYFSPDGRHLMTRGRRGRGPGEFNFAAALIRMPGDTIVVQDRPRLKHVFFTADGKYVREEALDNARLSQLLSRAECNDGALPDLSLLLCANDPGQPPPPPDPGPGHLRQYSRFVRVTWKLDSVFPLGEYGGIEQWGVDFGGETRFAVHGWHSRTAVAYGGNPMQVAIAINPAYSIEMWDAVGRLGRIIRRAGPPYVPTSEEREEARREMVSFARDEALANRFLAEVEEPTSRPAVAFLMIDSTNHLWVLQRSLATTGGGAPFDLFSPEGRYLGEVALPHRFMPHEIGSDYVLGVSRDEDNVPAVQLYTLFRDARS